MVNGSSFMKGFYPRLSLNGKPCVVMRFHIKPFYGFSQKRQTEPKDIV